MWSFVGTFHLTNGCQVCCTLSSFRQQMHNRRDACSGMTGAQFKWPSHAVNIWQHSRFHVKSATNSRGRSAKVSYAALVMLSCRPTSQEKQHTFLANPSNPLSQSAHWRLATRLRSPSKQSSLAARLHSSKATVDPFEPRMVVVQLIINRSTNRLQQGC